MESDLITKAIEEGHILASKICNAKTVAEVESLEKGEIEKYTDFLDSNFGVLLDASDEIECILTFPLYMAAEERILQLKYDVSKKNGQNPDMDYFESLLDSPNKWSKNSTEH